MAKRSRALHFLDGMQVSWVHCNQLSLGPRCSCCRLLYSKAVFPYRMTPRCRQERITKCWCWLAFQVSSARTGGSHFATLGYVNQLLCAAGSGKSTWATRYVANHPEKRYAVLSVDGIIKQLKVGVTGTLPALPVPAPWAHFGVPDEHEYSKC